MHRTGLRPVGNAKCRFGHLHKTFGDWIDTQYRDDDDRLVTEYRTPEGVVIPENAETLEKTSSRTCVVSAGNSLPKPHQRPG